MHIREIRGGGVTIGPSAGAYPGDILVWARALVIGVTERAERGAETIQTWARKWIQYTKSTNGGYLHITHILHGGPLEIRRFHYAVNHF